MTVYSPLIAIFYLLRSPNRSGQERKTVKSLVHQNEMEYAHGSMIAEYFMVIVNRNGTGNMILARHVMCVGFKKRVVAEEKRLLTQDGQRWQQKKKHYAPVWQRSGNYLV